MEMNPIDILTENELHDIGAYMEMYGGYEGN